VAACIPWPTSQPDFASIPPRSLLPSVIFSSAHRLENFLLHPRSDLDNPPFGFGLNASEPRLCHCLRIRSTTNITRSNQATDSPRADNLLRKVSCSTSCATSFLLWRWAYWPLNKAPRQCCSRILRCFALPCVHRLEVCRTIAYQPCILRSLFHLASWPSTSAFPQVLSVCVSFALGVPSEKRLPYIHGSRSEYLKKYISLRAIAFDDHYDIFTQRVFWVISAFERVKSEVSLF
jgi:hypothetical protein